MIGNDYILALGEKQRWIDAENRKPAKTKEQTDMSLLFNLILLGCLLTGVLWLAWFQA